MPPIIVNTPGLGRVGFTWFAIFAPAPLIMNEGLLDVLHLWPE